MIFATAHTIPGRDYTVLGLVQARKSHQVHTQVDEVLEELGKEAAKLKADAVIAIQFVQGTTKSGLMPAVPTLWAIGTAIRFT